MQLVDHRLHIRPVGLVKLPLALQRPVEEVNHDAVDLDALGLVAAGNREDLVLRAIAKLALPKPHQILREHRRMSADACVRRQDRLRGVRHGDPVVHVLRGSRNPLGDVLTEGHAAHRRIVPKHAVAKGRYQERNTDLGVALRKLQGAAL